MTGIYQHSIDAKGRLIIPSRMREELGDEFYVTISMENCLSAYSNESWERQLDRVKEMPRKNQIKMRKLYANAAKCELDSQGRILLPQRLREFADLNKNVAIVGTGVSVEIWDADKWAKVDAEETTPEKIAELFEELDF
jgi:MraZ protein